MRHTPKEVLGCCGLRDINQRKLFRLSSNCDADHLYLKHSFRWLWPSLHTHMQSHYREVPRWGVSNGARHNWKCFLAYKKFEVFFFNFICFWYIKMCHIYQKHFWGIWWFHRSKDFEAMKAGKLAIWPKSSPNLNSCSIKISHRGTSL